MNPCQLILGGVSVLLATGFLPLQVDAQRSPLVEETTLNKFGSLERIDHENKILWVTGFGTYDPDDVIDAGDMQRQAMLAARIDAQGKMAEIIGGVQVTGLETLEDMHPESTVELVAEALLDGFFEDDMQVRRLGDGSYLAIGTYRTRFLGAADLIDPATIRRNLETVRKRVPAVETTAEEIATGTKKAVQRDREGLEPVREATEPTEVA